MNKETLKLELEKLGFSNSVDELEVLMQETLKANESFNLTAIKEEEKFRELMLLDSVFPARLLDFKNKKILDVGTGAGYPGLPLAITQKEGQFTLLDSTKKKVENIANFVKKYEICNVFAVSDRVEDYAKSHRDEYDIVIARAVASLNILLELVLPLVKVGGYFIAMKGAKGKEEISEAKNALSKLGAVVEKIDEFELPESKEVRMNILIKKVKPTNKKYPRSYSEILSKTL